MLLVTKYLIVFYLQYVRFLLELFHRCFDLAIELPRPRDAPGHRRQVTRDDRLVLLLLVQLSHVLKVVAVLSDDLEVFLLQLELRPPDLLELHQQLYSLLSLERRQRIKG